MIDELRPATLTEAARRLGIDPFSLVRRQVRAGDTNPSWWYDEARLRALADGAPIDPPWLDAGSLPATPVGRARAMLDALLSRGAVGDKAVRADLLWRGLNAGDEALFRRLIAALAKEGLFVTTTAAGQQHVAIAAGAVDKVRAIATGATESHAFRSALVE